MTNVIDHQAALSLAPVIRTLGGDPAERLPGSDLTVTRTARAPQGALACDPEYAEYLRWLADRGPAQAPTAPRTPGRVRSRGRSPNCSPPGGPAGSQPIEVNAW